MLIELKDVNKTYFGAQPLHVLKGINLGIERGEFVSIMGASGSGKSTLLNILGILDNYDSGEYRINGKLIWDLTEAKAAEYRNKMIGFIFQSYNLIGFKTAVENVMVAQYYHSLPDVEEAMTALKRVGLEDRASHLPSQLSGGEQQRVCIARALINYPVLILADEPTGNLDEANQNLVMKIFHELHDEGHTIITVTHSPEVGREAGRCVVLEHGRIKE